jgi:hypothetical protein
VDSHIEWHVQEGTNGSVVRRDKDRGRKKSRSRQ